MLPSQGTDLSGQLTVDSPQVLHSTMDFFPEKVIGCLQMSHATENFGPLATSTRLPLQRGEGGRRRRRRGGREGGREGGKG